MKTKQPIAPERHNTYFLMKVFLGVFLTFLQIPGSVFAQQGKSVVSKEQQQRLDMMKLKGVDATLTILPVGLFGEPFERVSEVVGALLEQQGLKNIELGKSAFVRTTKPGLQALADSVGKFVKGHPVTTDYVLYAEMNGEPQKHQIAELVCIVVDKTGEVVWSDVLNSKDDVFRQVEDPDPICKIQPCLISGPLMSQRLMAATGLRLHACCII